MTPFRLLQRTSEGLDWKGAAAVVGLCAGCLGWHRDDPRIAEMNENIKLGIRVDRQGDLMVDFHTVKGNPRLATAGGGYRSADKSTIVSRRYYLQDASFLVAITSADAQKSC